MGVMLWRRGQAAHVLLALSFSVAHTGCARDAARASESIDSSELGAPLPRRFAPRLSVATEYAPCHVQPRSGDIVERSSCAPADPDPAPAVLNRARRASDVLARAPDVSALRAVALVDLEWSADSGIALDRSISYLRTASQLAPRPASSLADLSAAYLLRAERMQNVRDLLEAAEAADRSLTTEPSNHVAIFNRALAMEQLGLSVQADGAWTRYLAIDSTSDWGREARAHRARLRTLARSNTVQRSSTVADPVQLARSDPGRAAVVAWNNLLPSWGSAELVGDTTVALQTLHNAEQLGDALIDAGGDRSVAAAAADIRAVRGDPQRRRALAKAWRDYSLGQRLNARNDFAGARPWFKRATTESSGSPSLHQRSQLMLAAMLMYGGRVHDAEQMVRDVLAGELDTLRDASILGRARWTLGTVLLREGRYEPALLAYRAAARPFVAIHDDESVGAVQALTADAAFRLGDYDAGFAYARRAAATLVDHPSSLWRHNLLTVAAMAAADERLPYAAADLAGESVAAADVNGRPGFRVEARTSAARMRLQIGDTVRARAELAAARVLIESVPDRVLRQWLGADIQLATAAMHATGGGDAAAAMIDSAVTVFESLRLPLKVIPALLARADARFTLRHVRSGQADLDSAIALLSAEQTGIRDAGFRASFLEAARRAFDHQMLLDAERGDAASALRTLERGRVVQTASVHAPGSIIAAGRLPHGSDGIVLDYALVADTVLIWRITASGLLLRRSVVPRARLVSLIDAARASLEVSRSASAIGTPLTALYDMLLRPVVRSGASALDLTIIADGEVASVPFAALYDKTTHSYAAERHVLRYAATLADANARSKHSRAGVGSLAVVADPAFDRQRFPALARLPGAAAEAAAVARTRAGSVVLRDRAATPPAFRAALQEASILHYAGHALFDDTHPERSILVLAPESATSSGVLAADVISRMRLPREPLVVLSACETMRPGAGRSGDISGLARAFLHAGARGVLGSQWRASDRTTRVLMVNFYRELRRGHDPARALQAAQIELIHSQDPVLRAPSAWAAFRYAGE